MIAIKADSLISCSITVPRFYRCVKFDQRSSEYTVFEYDCPAGLAFDERVEVCVWPGSMPAGACHGSSEIAPVPRAQYGCPNVSASKLCSIEDKSPRETCQ